MNIEGVKQRLREVGSSRQQRYVVVVLLPTLLVFAYLGLVATDGYISRAQVMVERESSTAMAAAELTLGALSLGGQSSKTDALVVETFMRSRAMLEYLDAEFDLRGHYSSDDIDIFSRLDPDAPGEDFLDYFRDRIKTYVDDQTYIVELEVTAHDPAYAQRVAQGMVRRAEHFVNEISRELAREQLAFVEDEVEKANERFKAASSGMITLQRRYDVFSPEKEAEVAGSILSGLEQELSRQRTEYRALSAYLTPQAAELAAAKARIEALREQIEQERERLVGSNGGNGINDTLLAYQDAQMDLTLASEIYKTALGTLEATRLDAARKVKYLVALSSPSLPDAVEHPRVGYWTVTVFVALNLLYFVLGLVVATIEDHKE
ncbi:MAG: hypothetical protein ACPGJF_15240 [Sinimarinibacterium flocculans]|uniref:hypothetical protein n=1 Tax=Sinimarinibacterium flocculans TaxID=985250 RepID=UPI003C40F195